MNGYTKIVDKEGVEHTLYFGMQAAEEFALRTERHLTENSFKIAVDMVYAGIANQMTKDDVPPIPYTEVYKMLEELQDDNADSYRAQVDEVARCFWESKHGADYAKKLEEVKKKVVEELEALTKQSSNTGTSSGSMV